MPPAAAKATSASPWRRARLRRRHPDARDDRRRGAAARAPPEAQVRVIDVVDLMRLQPESEHPHGLSDARFDALFTTDKPVIFAYHSYDDPRELRDWVWPGR